MSVTLSSSSIVVGGAVPIAGWTLASCPRQLLNPALASHSRCDLSPSSPWTFHKLMIACSALSTCPWLWQTNTCSCVRTPRFFPSCKERTVVLYFCWLCTVHSSVTFYPKLTLWSLHSGIKREEGLCVFHDLLLETQKIFLQLLSTHQFLIGPPFKYAVYCSVLFAPLDLESNSLLWGEQIAISSPIYFSLWSVFSFPRLHKRHG